MNYFKELIFDWDSSESRCAEAYWKERTAPFGFMISCYREIRGFPFFSYEIEQIIFDSEGEEIAILGVPEDGATLRFSLSLAEAKMKAVAELQNWVESGRAELLKDEAFAPTSK
ncbi:hypothetical protein [Rhizobium mayense]|uniref:Uncharacterized protein n=1 Tax=Rhizobium mayense TaxID=1312184 RepID=A0ABT7JW63_9HYPH|nr:hypothetical protein [Rhizobium mayense]MDL2399443.1 hypothetical protein [Rhizobium mayense]